MESIIKNVKDMESDKREWIESALDCHLKENQQVMIHVLNVGVVPDEKTRSEELSKASEIAKRGRANAALQGVAEENVTEAGEVIDEAIRHYRQQKHK